MQVLSLKVAPCLEAVPPEFSTFGIGVASRISPVHVRPARALRVLAETCIVTNVQVDILDPLVGFIMDQSVVSCVYILDEQDAVLEVGLAKIDAYD